MPIAMLIIGMGIVMVPPMILEALYSYSPDNETVIEEATNSPLMMSYFSFCTSYSRFNWTRYKGNSSQNPYWKRSKHVFTSLNLKGIISNLGLHRKSYFYYYCSYYQP